MFIIVLAAAAVALCNKRFWHTIKRTMLSFVLQHLLWAAFYFNFCCFNFRSRTHTTWQHYQISKTQRKINMLPQELILYDNLLKLSCNLPISFTTYWTCCPAENRVLHNAPYSTRISFVTDSSNYFARFWVIIIRRRRRIYMYDYIRALKHSWAGHIMYTWKSEKAHLCVQTTHS